MNVAVCRVFEGLRVMIRNGTFLVKHSGNYAALSRNDAASLLLGLQRPGTRKHVSGVIRENCSHQFVFYEAFRAT